MIFIIKLVTILICINFLQNRPLPVDLYRINYIVTKLSAASHIPQFADAGSPAGDLLTSPNFGICDTTEIFAILLVFRNIIRKEYIKT
jgi:hypothetical protein